MSTTRLDTSSFQGKSGTQRTKKGWFFDTGWRHVVAILTPPDDKKVTDKVAALIIDTVKKWDLAGL